MIHLMLLYLHTTAKFFGACNDAKAALDKCFKAEKDKMRKKAAEKYPFKFEPYEQFIKEYEKKDP